MNLVMIGMLTRCGATENQFPTDSDGISDSDESARNSLVTNNIERGTATDVFTSRA